MKTLLLRSPTAVVVAMLVVVGLAACPAGAWADDGHWVLSGIWYKTPEKIEYIQKGILLSFKISSRPTTRGVITQMEYFTPDKPLVIVDKYAISWEWTAIPVALRPGDKIPMTLRGVVADHPTWEKGFVGHCYPLITAEFWRPGPDEWDRIGGFTTGKVQFSSSDAKNKSGLAQITGTVPGGSEGGKLALVVAIVHPDQIRWDRQYVYTWDPAPFPTSVPDPIPAGQTTLEGGGGGGEGGTGVGEGGTGGGEGGTAGGEGGTGGGEGGGGGDDDPLKGQPAGMTLQADRRTVKVGGSVTVPIRMLNGRNVGNLDFKVTYDPAVVRPQGKAIRGNLLDNASMQSNPADSGRVWIAFATAGRINGDGTIAQLPFEAVGQPGQKTVLGLEVTIFNESTDSSQITQSPGEI